jgi:hypothetical protein
MKADMKKVIKLLIEAIFLLGAIYGLRLFTQAAQTINLNIPF